jgi:photosystem II stability/assembly factor-like uncharacterized protein
MKSALLFCLLAGACTPLPFKRPIEKRILPMPVESVAFNPLSGGKTIYASGSLQGKILRSYDRGKTWDTLTINGVALGRNADVTQLVCLPFDTSTVFAVVRGIGLFTSHDGGISWKESIVEEAVRGEPLAVHVASKILFFSGYFACAVWSSSDSGRTWLRGAGPSDSIIACALAVLPTPQPILLQGSEDGYITRSTDKGITWNVVLGGDRDTFAHLNPEVSRFFVNQNKIIAARWLAKERTIMVSTNQGLSWYELKSPSRRIWSVTARLDQIWVGVYNINVNNSLIRGILCTTNEGKSWEAVDNKENQIVTFGLDENTGSIAAASDRGLFLFW